MPKQNIERSRGSRKDKLRLKGEPQEGAAGQSIPGFQEVQVKTLTTQEILFVYGNSHVNRPSLSAKLCTRPKLEASHTNLILLYFSKY